MIKLKETKNPGKTQLVTNHQSTVQYMPPHLSAYVQ